MIAVHGPEPVGTVEKDRLFVVPFGSVSVPAVSAPAVLGSKNKSARTTVPNVAAPTVGSPPSTVLSGTVMLLAARVLGTFNLPAETVTAPV